MCLAIGKFETLMDRDNFIVTVWENVAPTNFICLSVSLIVCPALTAFISVTMPMGRILMKLGGSRVLELTSD